MYKSKEEGKHNKYSNKARKAVDTNTEETKQAGDAKEEKKSEDPTLPITPKWNLDCKQDEVSSTLLPQGNNLSKKHPRKVRKHRRAKSSRRYYEIPTSNEELKQVISDVQEELSQKNYWTASKAAVSTDDVVLQALNDRLLKAANSYEPESIVALVKMKADPNMVDHVGFSALMWAAHTNSLGCVNALLKSKANAAQSTVLGWTALMDAAQQGNEWIMSALIEARSMVNSISMEFDRTALHYAAFVECPGNIKRLIDAGAEHVTDSSGQTPLIIASEAGLLENVKVLVEHEGLAILNIRGIIAGILTHFCPELPKRIAALICEMAVRPCDVSMVNFEGQNALDVAYDRGYQDIVTYLIKCVDVGLKDRGVLV